MNILFLSDVLSYGGASKLLKDLVPLIRDDGHQCQMLILTDEKSKHIDYLQSVGIKVDVVPKDIKGHWAKIKYIRNYVLQGNFDVLHANLFPMLYYVAIAKRLSGKKFPPIVMTEHSTDNKRRHHAVLRPLERFIYKSYNHVISITDQAQQQLLAWLRLSKKLEENFSVIDNGVDVAFYQNAKPLNREELVTDVKESDVLIGIVGSFTRPKNHAKMVESLKYLPTNYKLVLVGEGPLMENIKALAEEHGVNDRVYYLGFRKDVAEIMHTVDLLAIPSIWEGFGLIAAEAMASGTSIVASNVPGLSDVVADCGLKFDPYDSKKIAETILMLGNKSLVDVLKQRAKERIKLYDIAITKQKYIDVLKQQVEAP